MSVITSEVVELCSELIRFDTSNFGEGQSRGELEAARWVAEKLRECGYQPEVVESGPGRASTVVRIPGADRTRGALLLHGHLDVVPAEAGDWSVDPFAGEIRDGAVWGRGAIDMKGTDATMLAVARGLARDHFTPDRDLVFAFVADEEAGGQLGAGYLVERRPDLLAGVTHAIGEGGGYLVRLPDGGHLYPVAAAERGTAWMRLVAHGTAGHGSRSRAGSGGENPVAVLSQTVSRLASIEWPVRVVPAVEALLSGLGDRLGAELDARDPALSRTLGDAGELINGVLSNTLNPTMLEAGYKPNVIPSDAVAVLDGRIVPGLEEEFFAAVDAELPDSVSRSFISYQQAISSDHDDPEFDRIRSAIQAHDPGALVLPCCSAGGTDAKWFDRLGIACYGFASERYPADFDGDALVHGVDERIPIESLHFGVEVLDTYLRTPPADTPSKERP